MRRKPDNTKISFTLTKAGCSEGPSVEMTMDEFADLSAQVRTRKPKVGPKTKGQQEATALFSEFVRRGLGRQS